MNVKCRGRNECGDEWLVAAIFISFSVGVSVCPRFFKIGVLFSQSLAAQLYNVYDTVIY